MSTLDVVVGAPPRAAESVLSHSASRLVALEDLAAIPPGERLGPRHKPVPHIEFVAAVKDAFLERGYAVAKELYSVTREGARLFGTVDLLPTTGRSLTDGMDGGMAVGLRHSNDAAFALGVIAGLRVFVCDNLCFSGGKSLLRRKHTTGLELRSEIDRGMERTFHSFQDLARLVENLKDTPLSDEQAKVLIYNLALDGHVIAPSQLSKVHSWYFEPEQVAGDADIERGFDDVQTRTAYSVMGAVTRTTR
ncbi:MAG: DUF932 domain-containing protein, partial [Candidatus Dormibacteria bacterium]